MSSCTCHGHVWHVDTAPGKTINNKTECMSRRPPIGGWKKIAGLNGIRCELVKPSFWQRFCEISHFKVIAFLFNPFASEAVYIYAIFFPTACRTACKHAFCFFLVRPEAVSTRHSWLWQTLDDVYTRRCFSESEGTRFGAPGQKALPSGNEWTEWNEWMDFCLIPLSTTGSVEVPGTNL